MCRHRVNEVSVFQLYFRISSLSFLNSTDTKRKLHQSFNLNLFVKAANSIYSESGGGGGGVHIMLRVRVCAAHMGWFLGQNSLKKGPFFGRFFIDMGGLSRIGEK